LNILRRKTISAKDSSIIKQKNLQQEAKQRTCRATSTRGKNYYGDKRAGLDKSDLQY